MTHAIGRWSFEREERGGAPGCRVLWTYSAFPVNAVARPATALITGVFLKGAMQDCLSRVKVLCELALAPRWTPDAERTACEDCGKNFTSLRRRHHCALQQLRTLVSQSGGAYTPWLAGRNCAGIFCRACSKKRKALPHYGIHSKVRVCNTCFDASGVAPASAGATAAENAAGRAEAGGPAGGDADAPGIAGTSEA